VECAPLIAYAYAPLIAYAYKQVVHVTSIIQYDVQAL
jgi:hypothetical protein